MRCVVINMKINKKSGFTLVELLIVMAIMAILITVISGSFRNIQLKSRDARRKNDLSSISKALNMYYTDVGNFPMESDKYGINLNGLMNNGDRFYIDANDKEIVYMVEIPKETAAGLKNYKYVVSDTGKSFKLFANLENGEDGSCLKSGESNITFFENVFNIEMGCIYGVSSSNVGVTTATLSMP